MPRKSTTRKLTEIEIAIVKKRLSDGEFQHHIAAEFRVNQGRISEINTGKVGAHIPPLL